MQVLQIEDPTKWKTSREDSQRARAKENTGRSKKWSSLNEWCDNWNVSVERQQYSRYFDAISSGTCGDVPDMTDWSTDILICVCQRSQGQGTNQEKTEAGKQDGTMSSRWGTRLAKQAKDSPLPSRIVATGANTSPTMTSHGSMSRKEQLGRRAATQQQACGVRQRHRNDECG